MKKFPERYLNFRMKRTNWLIQATEAAAGATAAERLRGRALHVRIFHAGSAGGTARSTAGNATPGSISVQVTVLQ